MRRSSLFRPALTALLLAAAAVVAGCAQQQAPKPMGGGPASQPPVASQPATPPLIQQENVPPAVPAAPVEPPIVLRPPASADGKVRVGVIVPLSGQAAGIGRALLDAAHLALFDVGDSRLVLLPRDSKGTPEGAAAAAQDLLAQGAQLIVGPLFAGEVAAVAPVARAGRVPVLGFSTDRTVAGDNVWLLGLAPDDQVARVVAFAHSRGLNRVGLIAPENAYGTAVDRALREAVQRLGLQLGRTGTYPTDVNDLTPYVRHFADYDARRASLAQQRRDLQTRDDELSKQALARLTNIETVGDPGFDALLVAEGGQRLKSLAPLLAYFDVDPKRVRFLGTGLWDEPGLGTEPALQGGWFATTAPAGVAEFRRRYEAAYNRRPPRIASLGFDAVALAAVLARDDVPQPFAPERLTNAEGFAGYDGIFRLRPDGQTERGLAVIEILPRDIRVIDSAPTTFQPALN